MKGQARYEGQSEKTVSGTIHSQRQSLIGPIGQVSFESAVGQERHQD